LPARLGAALEDTHMTRSLGFALMVALVGCEEKKEPPPPPPAPPAAAAPAAPAAAAPAAAAAAPGAPAAAAPGAPAAAAPGAPAADPAKALGAAMNAAAEAKGDTPCEQAFNAIDAMIKAMEKNMPPGGNSTGQMPDKAKFIAGCKELPPQVQQCMVMSYAMAHQQECKDAQAKVDPATMAKVKALMGGK
jgi:hypothetical protein